MNMTGCWIPSVQGSRIPGAAVPDGTPADEGALGVPAVVTATKKPVPSSQLPDCSQSHISC